MHKGCVSDRLTPIRLFLATLVFYCGVTLADPIDDAEDLPATADEVQFINKIISSVNEAVPAIEGWHRDVRVSASGNTVREGKTPLIYSRARDFPLKISIHVKYQEITQADRKEAATEKTAQQLQEEMMEAAMRGDTAKMEKLQLELAAMMRANMEAGPIGQAVGKTPVQPREDPKRFHVQITVNGDGETIGKQYDFDAPEVTKAFRTDKADSESLSYKYYMGGWEISELDNRNWRVVDPADAQTAANHLKALVALVSVYGDRTSVEDFVGNYLDLVGLNQMVE